MALERQNNFCEGFLKKNVLTALFPLLFGFMALMGSLSKPRVEALHGSDIVGLMAAGACFGIGFTALFGRLRMPNNDKLSEELRKS